MYFYYCDDSSLLGKKRLLYKDIEVLKTNIHLPRLPLAFLELKLSYIDLDQNRLTLLYHFAFNDTIEVESTTKSDFPTFGVEFDIKRNAVNGYCHGEGIFYEKGVNVRYENPYHPVITSFIKNNQDRLNSWFRNEAKRRGFI